MAEIYVCISCGVHLNSKAKYCKYCGTPEARKETKAENDKIDAVYWPKFEKGELPWQDGVPEKRQINQETKA